MAPGYFDRPCLMSRRQKNDLSADLDASHSPSLPHCLTASLSPTPGVLYQRDGDVRDYILKHLCAPSPLLLPDFS
ncbi:hypothetical protein E2C01_090944 [Portunus trituberculatus]|uniref:Uncharacterized protein n=1 Tax=Portunus trituberculatus TaxID=210409 RepID=A0A5B7JG34_PORTR|nr:hypothetical protein [Portunus trituberculatus]